MIIIIIIIPFKEECGGEHGRGRSTAKTKEKAFETISIKYF